MNEILQQLRARWLALNPREQGLLAGAALLCLFALPYMLVWRPMVREIPKLRTEVSVRKAQLTQMREEAKTAPAQNGNQRGSQGGGTDLLSDVENSATSLGVRDAITRIDTDNSNQVHLELANADFDTLAKWIWQMEHDLGIQVLSATIHADSTPGRVDASLRIDRR